MPFLSLGHAAGHVIHSFFWFSTQIQGSKGSLINARATPLTSSWVTERSSQYLIHLVKSTNIQPHNNIMIKIKTKKITKDKRKEKPKIYLC